MSTDDEGFLSRWSRLKRDRSPAEKPDEKTADLQTPAEPEPEPLDLAALPKVEELTAESDFRPFLQTGVPTALRTAALRKLWVSDPQFREYKPLVEYDWDFNAPGYGALRVADDVQKFVRQIFAGEPEKPAEPTAGLEGDPPAPPDPVTEVAAEPPETAAAKAIPQAGEQAAQSLDGASSRLRHGAARPS